MGHLFGPIASTEAIEIINLDIISTDSRHCPDI